MATRKISETIPKAGVSYGEEQYIYKGIDNGGAKKGPKKAAKKKTTKKTK